MIGAAEAGAFSERRHDGVARIEERLAALPRFRLIAAPTPLQPLRRLSERLGGPALWVKRDALTGLAFGGNKVRQMEFFVGEAKARCRRSDRRRKLRAIEPCADRQRRSSVRLT